MKQFKFDSNPKIKDLLHSAEIELRKIFNDKLKKIILFGSYSRGDNGKESDVDVMVLIDDPNPNRYENEVLDVEVDLSLEYDMVLTLFLENENKYIEGRIYKPFFKEIEKEGIEIYAA